MKEKKSATNPFYTIMHPFNCSYDIRFKEKGNGVLTIIILAVFFLTSIYQRQSTGYIFNDNKLSELNVFVQFISVILPFVLFVTANWIVAILMNGTGRFRDIWIYGAYCCIPFILGNIVSVWLSNILVMEEPFGGYVQIAGATWSLVILFIGLMIMHEYGFTQNVFSCICTILVMFILLFLIMLVGNLASDLYGFVMTVAKELIFRMS
ncbi:MAG TPA: hypothetical protein DCZ91_06465 [Lachnospiraceae bacterium]|nr:hypothetical protein [Lachnospiraceae bacterium]